MLFAKNKPTERLTFGDDYIELQHLSKGVLDEIKSRAIKVFAEAGTEALKAVQTAKSEDDMPAEMLAQSGEMLKVQHYKVAQAIVKWSSEEPVNEDTVKALDEDVFMQVSAKVDEMNQLKETERKN